jgi:hypothetical protein
VGRNGRSGTAAPTDVHQADVDFISARAEHERGEAWLRRVSVNADPDNKSRNRSILASMVAPGGYWNDTTLPLQTNADASKVVVTANLPDEARRGRAASGRRPAAYPGKAEWRSAIIT